MKNFEVVFPRPPKALALHIFAQMIYIWFVFKNQALPRELWQPVLVVFICIFIDCLYRSILSKEKKIYAFSFVAWAIGNSVFVNSEIYSISGYVLCAVIAIFSKILLVDSEGKHIFNPSVFAVVAAAVLYPNSVSAGGLTFGDQWPLNLIVILVGGLAVTAARSWPIILAYNLGFAVISFVVQLVGNYFQLWPKWEILTLGPGFWAASLLSMGSLIFTFGVISDPQTSPKGNAEKIYFGLTIAVIDFILRKNKILMPEAFAYLITQSLMSFSMMYKRRSKMVGSTGFEPATSTL